MLTNNQPEAATSSTNAKTFLFFSFAKSIILFAIKEDCVGEPPGELMTKPTTGDFLSLNNLSITFSKLFIAKPEPVNPDCDDIMPDKRKTGIVVLFENNLLNILFNNKC